MCTCKYIYSIKLVTALLSCCSTFSRTALLNTALHCTAALHTSPLSAHMHCAKHCNIVLQLWLSIPRISGKGKQSSTVMPVSVWLCRLRSYCTVKSKSKTSNPYRGIFTRKGFVVLEFLLQQLSPGSAEVSVSTVTSISGNHVLQGKLPGQHTAEHACLMQAVTACVCGSCLSGLPWITMFC